MSNLTNKVILITGASSGIGEAAARLLAQRGARVVIGARRTERLARLANEIRAAGGTAEYRALDVTNLADVQAFADFALQQFGTIDVIINNAGVMPLSPLAELGCCRSDRHGLQRRSGARQSRSQPACRRDDGARAGRTARRHRADDCGLLSEENRWVNAQRIEVSGGMNI